MPIDPTGTAPGLITKDTKPPRINMRCPNDGCDSITAIELKIAAPETGARLYQCCKCKHTRGVAVGGCVNL